MCLESDSLSTFPIDPLTHLLMQTHGAHFFFFFWITPTQVHTLIHSEYCPEYIFVFTAVHLGQVTIKSLWTSDPCGRREVVLSAQKLIC